MTDTTISVTGGCLCGKVRYRAAKASPDVAECHCSQCRRQSGHRYATIRADNQGFELERHETLAWYSASQQAERGFCAVCGSTLFWRADGSDHVALLAGSVDEPNQLRMARHIFVDDKGSCYEIDDGLPQFRDSTTPVGS